MSTESEYQQKIKDLFKDVQKFIDYVENRFDFKTNYPFNKLYLWLEKQSCEECIEYVVSIMMEPYGKITEPLVNQMSSDEDKYFNIPTNRKVDDLRSIIKKKYKDILLINFDKKENNKKFCLFQKTKRSQELLIGLRKKALN